MRRLSAPCGVQIQVISDGRSGNVEAPEFIVYAVADWCRFNGTDTVFIDPGSAY
jgi:hypothetical protein